MANGKTLGQVLIEKLAELNINFKNVSETIKKIETNEIESFKNNYEFKYSVLSELKKIADEYKDTIHELSKKIDIKDTHIINLISEIKELQGLKISFILLSNGKLSDVTINDKIDNSLCKVIRDKLEELPKEWFPALSKLENTLDGDYGPGDEKAKQHIRVNSILNIQF